MTSKHVVIAEDEQALAKVVKVKLEKAGFTVEIVDTGKKALERIEAGGVDLVLLDLLMPEMGGFELLEKLQEMKNRPLVVVTSNLSQDEDIIKAKELGATDFMIKSNVSLSQIVEKVSSLLTA